MTKTLITPAEAEALQALEHVGELDCERRHMEVDGIIHDLLRAEHPRVYEAVRRIIKNASWWAFA